MEKYIKTFITQLYAAISGIILVKIMTVVLSQDVLGLFIVVRRLVLFSFPLLAINLNTASAKFVSSDEENSNEYIKLGLIVFLINYTLIAVVSFVLKDQIAIMLFNDLKYRGLLLVLFLYMFSVTFYSFVVNFYRGQRKFGRMNSVTLFYWTVALTAIPVSIAIGKGDSFRIVFDYFLVFSFLVMLLVVPWSIKLFLVRSRVKISRIRKSEFFKYGIFRLPSNLFASGIFFLPVYMTSKFYGLSDAAIVGLVVYLVQLSHIFGTSMGMLLLPEFSFRGSVYTRERLKSDFQKLFEFVISVFTIMGIILFLFIREIIWVMFDKAYIVYESLFSIGALMVGFYLAYVVCRSVLDGLYVKPYSTLVNFAGAIAFTLSAIVLKKFSLRGVVASFAIAIALISFFSIFILKVKLDVQLISRKNLCILSWAVVIFLIFAGLRLTTNNLSFLYSFGVKTVVCGIVLMATFFLYKRLGLFWIRKIIKFTG